MTWLKRGPVLHYRNQECVQAARIVGAPSRAIMWRHLLSNIIDACIMAETLVIPADIFMDPKLRGR